MNLLQYPEGSGYPTEYLIARIRGRRVYLVKDWDHIIHAPSPIETLLPVYYRELINEYANEGVWKRMLRECAWVCLQMNGELRNIFRPFFVYAEIKTIVLCLRYKTGKEAKTDIENLLSFSLLSKEVKEVLQREADLPLILEELERKFLFSPDKPWGLQEIFLKDGLGGVEDRLNDNSIEQIMSSKLHPVMKKFFIFIVDIKNIITLYKYVRWAVKTEPVFLQGGSIRESTLAKMLQSGRIPDVARLIYQLSGIRIKEPDASTVESTLHTGLTKELRSMAIKNSDIGFILDYLWKIYIEAQNLSILLYGRDIERNVLKKELVI